VRELAPAFGLGTICGEQSGGKPPHSKESGPPRRTDSRSLRHSKSPVLRLVRPSPGEGASFSEDWSTRDFHLVSPNFTWFHLVSLIFTSRPPGGPAMPPTTFLLKTVKFSSAIPSAIGLATAEASATADALLRGNSRIPPILHFFASFPEPGLLKIWTRTILGKDE
jgi:hypothetical protein